MVTFFSFPSPMMVVALNIQCVQKLGLEVEVCSIKYNKNMATTSPWQHLQKFNSTVDLSMSNSYFEISSTVPCTH